MHRRRRNKRPELPELEFKRPTFEPLGERGIDRKIAAARALGAEHGKVGLPGPDHVDVAAVNAYVDEGEGLLLQIARDWHDINGKLRGEWCRLRQLVRGREKQLPAAQAVLDSAQRRVNDKQVASDMLRSEAQAAPRGSRYHIGRLPYIAGLVALFLIDVPLNAAVFQIFGENQIATWVLAGLLGVLVVPLAHILGIQIRHSFPSRTMTAIAVVGPLLLIVAVAFLRTKYLQENNINLGASGAVGVVLFIAFNLAVFSSAIALSYLRHDPFEQALEEAETALKKAKRELAEANESFNRLADELSVARGRIVEIHTWGEEELAKAKDWAAAERNFFERLIDNYLMQNQAARARPQDVVRALENAKHAKPSTPIELDAQAFLLWTCDDEPGPDLEGGHF